MNYTASWGLDDKTCAKVFDTVANCASFIINKIGVYMEASAKEFNQTGDNTENKIQLTMINEDFLREDAGNAVISGEEVAEMVGMGDQYRQGKAQIAQETNMMEAIKAKFDSINERMNKVPKGMDLFD